MTDRDSTEVPEFEPKNISCTNEDPKRWTLPSFLVRHYQFGYERECHDLLFAGDTRRGARDLDAAEDAEVLIFDLQD